VPSIRVSVELPLSAATGDAHAVSNSRTGISARPEKSNGFE
jgi:hypothetical protein